MATPMSACVSPNALFDCQSQSRLAFLFTGVVFDLNDDTLFSNVLGSVMLLFLKQEHEWPAAVRLARASSAHARCSCPPPETSRGCAAEPLVAETPYWHPASLLPHARDESLRVNLGRTCTSPCQATNSVPAW